MKKILIILAIIAGNEVFSQSLSQTSSLESMITIINKSLDVANDQLSSNMLDIETAVITLKTTYDTSGGGGFSLFVKASKKWELDKANTMKFVYEKADKTFNKWGLPSSSHSVFKNNLISAIVSAANQWQETTQTVDGLSKSKFSVEISFMVKKSGGGGIEFEIWGAGIDLSGDYENTAVHTISLTFK